MAVEHRHQPLFTGKTLVDEQIFLVVAHGISEVDILDLPSVPLELMAHHPMEVLLVDGIVAAESGAVVVENHDLALVVGVVAAEIVNQCRYLALELGVERLDDVEPSACGLPGNNPVDVGVVVHADADGGIRVQVLVGSAVELGLVEVVAQTVEVFKIAGVVLVRLTH